MSEGTILTPVTDRSLFSMHPEDWVTQADSHDEQCIYFKQALRRLLPDCFVARDLAVYWVPGQYQHPYVGPDVFIARNRPRVEDPTAWLTYEDGPLGLVIEIASETTRAGEEGKRDRIYAAQLEVPEYVYLDLRRDELRLERLVEGRYERVAADAQGRLWSQEFGFGLLWREQERLVRVLTPDGEIIPTRQEADALQREAEARVAREAQRAAREAERAEREARHAQEEAAQRAVAEQRAAELAAEVDRLRRLLQDGDDPSSPED